MIINDTYTVKGHVTIKARTPEVLADFLYLREIFTKGRIHRLKIDEVPWRLTYVRRKIKSNEETLEFHENLRTTSSSANFFVEDFICDVICHESRLRSLDLLQDKLKNEVIVAEFDYIDTHTNVNKLYHKVATVVYDGTAKEEENKYKSEIKILESSTFTVENLIKYNVEREGVIVSINYLMNNLDYFDKYRPELVNNRVEILSILEKEDKLFKGLICETIEDLFLYANNSERLLKFLN